MIRRIMQIGLADANHQSVHFGELGEDQFDKNLQIFNTEGIADIAKSCALPVFLDQFLRKQDHVAHRKYAEPLFLAVLKLPFQSARKFLSPGFTFAFEQARFGSVPVNGQHRRFKQ